MSIERQHEQAPEYQEYSFEAGLQEIMNRIEQLIKRQDGVVVAISGSSYQVGKTTLGGTIGRLLSEKNIERLRINELPFPERDDVRIKLRSSQNKGVLILQEERLSFQYGAKNIYDIGRGKQIQDAVLSRWAQKNGLPFYQINLRILIYHPEVPFDDWQLLCGDIIIRNERADRTEKTYIQRNLVDTISKKVSDFKAREEEPHLDDLDPEEILQLFETIGVTIWEYNFEEGKYGELLWPSDHYLEIQIYEDTSKPKVLITFEEYPNGNCDVGIQIEPYTFYPEIVIKLDNSSPQTLKWSLVKSIKKAKFLLQEASQNKR